MTEPGVFCKFPFRHSGKLYKTCVKEDDRYWCAERIASDMSIIKQGICTGN